MTLVFALKFLDISRSDMVDAIAPLIGQLHDPNLSESVLLVARMSEGGPGVEVPEFSHYQSYIEPRLRTRRDIDPGLVAHMFRRSPGQALQTFTMVTYQDDRRKPLLWARHVVDDALWKRKYGFVPRDEPDPAVTEQLEKMAERDEWWARLYSAEIIRQHPQFGSPSVVERLQSDPHPLVQQTAKSIGSSTQDSRK